MISILVFVALLLGPPLVLAWVFTFLARRLGSERSRFRTGLMVAAGLVAVGIASTVAQALLPVKTPEAGLVVAGFLLIFQMLVAFFVIRRAYRLTAARALVPLIAYAVVVLDQIPLALFVIRPYVMESFSIPTRSMEPTLRPGDCIVANKLIAPRRWDLVAYWTNDEAPEIFCSRLVGLPGDRLRFDDGELFINDQAATPPQVTAGRYRAVAAGAPPSYFLYRDGDTISLGEDEFFFLSDNVDRAVDSRMRGPTHRSYLVGTIDLQYWPLDRLEIRR